MMASHTFLVRLTFALMMYLVYGEVNQVPLPTIDLNECWGPMVYYNGTLNGTNSSTDAPNASDTSNATDTSSASGASDTSDTSNSTDDSNTTDAYNTSDASNSTNATDSARHLRCRQNYAIQKYTIQFKDTMIADLISRLKSHRTFTPALEGISFEYGFNVDYLKIWIQYLTEQYKFKEREAFLNQYSHYKTMIQGLNIHFIRVQSENLSSYSEVVPLLILHGWPGSVREFYEAIPYLLSSSKAQGFGLDIIIPSLPGFGFSDGAVRPGLGVDKVAIVCRNLMHRLGYLKYFVQGGDLGSMIASAMSTFFPNEVKGYHMNFALLHTPDILFRLIYGSYFPDEIATPNTVNRIYPLTSNFFNLTLLTGYLHIQATKPDTIGEVLTDSPSGLMAYTFEKINHQLPNEKTSELTAEKILDNYMIYWSTNSINTAVRMYSETFNKRYIGLRLNEIRTPVPTWVIQPPHEVIYLPGWMIKQKFPNLLNETVPDVGGHYYAWTYPQAYAESVVNALVAFRKWHVMNSNTYTNCTMYINN